MSDLNQPEDQAPVSGPEMDPLDRIGLEAQGMEQEAQAAEDKILHGEPESEPVIDPAHAWGQLAMMAGGILTMALPELKSVYTEQNCMAWGGGMAAVADKYGWDAGDTMAKWAPECMLIMTSIPLIVPTVQAIKSRQAAAKAKSLNEAPKRPENAMAGPNNADTVDVNPMMQPPGNFSEPT